ncbi:hypothetical protein KEM56_003045 [Ascosphaera pollenicola]|nr:hypothetical protein KEM56_003045 [Ascosphaera pollenicola]
MINGTKLLNVAGMTRGRRDGILKSEKLRHVVKIGPMHLKGVWIPYERALEFANKEKITDLLYPLFVHNIGSLLMHPQNPSRANALIAASERRRLESRTPAITTQAQAPNLNHHSMGAPQQLPAPLGHSRHESGRSHTFPTPPGSSASVLNGHGSGYEWAGNVQSQQPLSIDTSMAAARSLPATPATTPPGPPVHGIPSYQNAGSYDAKPYYTTSTSSASQYPGHPSLAHASHADGDNHQDGHGEYMSSASYASNRASYPYSAPAPVGTLTNDSPQVSPIVTESGPSESRPERIHSRHGSQSHWSYPRSGGSSNVYSVMSDPRATDSYSAGAGSTYASAAVNGYSKRSREEDSSADSKVLADAQVGDSTEGKRRRTLVDATRPSIALHTRPGSASSVGRRL